MITIKGIEFRSLEGQVKKNMEDIATQQNVTNKDFDDRITELEESAPDMSEYVTKDTAQQITGEKTFTHPITINAGAAVVELGDEGISGGVLGGYLAYPPDLLDDPDYDETIATLSDISGVGGEIYKHYIEIGRGEDLYLISFISSRSTAYTSTADLDEDKDKILGTSIFAENSGNGGIIVNFSISGNNISIVACSFAAQYSSISLSNANVSELKTTQL